MRNIEITKKELSQLRALPDFDLTMVLSDINDYGWQVARKTLPLAVEAVQAVVNLGWTDTSGRH